MYKLYINKIFTFIIFVYNFSKITAIILLLLSFFKTLFKFLNIINTLMHCDYI